MQNCKAAFYTDVIGLGTHISIAFWLDQTEVLLVLFTAILKTWLQKNLPYSDLVLFLLWDVTFKERDFYWGVLKNKFSLPVGLQGPLVRRVDLQLWAGAQAGRSDAAPTTADLAAYLDVLQGEEVEDLGPDLRREQWSHPDSHWRIIVVVNQRM